MSIKSQSWDNLKFFNKKGQNLNLQKINGVWTGNIFLPKVSVEILESEHIFILEKLYDTVNSKLVYAAPQNKDTITDPSKFHIYFKTNDYKFNLYDVQVLEPNPVIIKSNEEDLLLDSKAWIGTTTVNSKDYKNVTSLSKKSLQLNITFSSSEEEIVENLLIIDFIPDSNSAPERVAEINLRAETEGEDERFKLMLENFGRKVDQSDSILFREVDINELKPNWIKLNQKRKELLLEGDNIFPYIGSYKAIINALNFYGYQDLKIKEYWLNIDVKAANYGKITKVEIPRTYDPKFSQSELITNKKFKKTSHFGLYYNINEETSEENEYDLPIVKDSFMFSNEEVLLKLFSLKERLKKDFLPLNARIIDITGEGVYFEKFKLKTWIDQTFIRRIDSGDETIDFTVSPEVSWIKDLRPLSHNYPTPRTITAESHPSLIIRTINDHILAYFEDIGDRVNHLADDIGIPIGAEINLETKSLEVSWDELDINWDELIGVNDGYYTWSTIGYGINYEIEWVIEKKTDKSYYFSKRGPLTDLIKFKHYLPYVGKYDVKLNIYDLLNGVSRKVKDDAIEVLSHAADFTMFSRMLDKPVHTWNATTFNWNNLNSMWDLPIQNTTKIDDLELTYEDLNWANYRNQEIFSWDFQFLPWKDTKFTWDSNNFKESNFGTISLTWDNFKWNTIDELWHQTWDMLDYKGSIRGGYNLTQRLILAEESQIPAYYFKAYGTFTIPETGFDAGDSFFIHSTAITEGVDFTIKANDYLTAEAIVTAINNNITSVTASHDYSLNSNGEGVIKLTAKVYGVNGNNIAISVITGNAEASGSHLQFGGQKQDMEYGIDKDTKIWIGSFNNGYPFEFTNDLENNNWTEIANQLNNSSIEGINLFNYTARSLNDPTLVHAVANFDGNYGNQKFVIARKLLDVYTTYTFDSPNGPITFSMPYTDFQEIDPGVINGSFTYNDIWTWPDETEVPTCLPVFFTASKCKIPGKTNIKWKIYNEKTTELVAEIFNPWLIWIFKETGMWSIEIEITDSNKNIIKNYKKGILKTVKKDF